MIDLISLVVQRLCTLILLVWFARSLVGLMDSKALEIRARAFYITRTIPPK